MADNTQLNAGTGGDLLSTDDIGGGVKVQRVKIQHGADGSATDVTPTTALPVNTAYAPTMTVAAGSGAHSGTAIDMLGYTWAQLYWTSIGTGNVGLQMSPDNTNWYSPPNMDYVNQSGAWVTNFSAATVTGVSVLAFQVPVFGRYMRLAAAGTTTGTHTMQVVLSNTAFQSFTQATLIKGTTNTSDALTSTAALSVVATMLGYVGNNAWDRLRVPNKINWGQAVSSGNTAVWTPASGKKFRLMRYKISIPGHSTTSVAGTQTLSFQDGAGGATNIVETMYVPSTASNWFGSWSTGWIDLGNGFISTAANNALNINLNKTMLTGSVDVQVVGTEE